MNFKKFLDQLCHICKRGKRLFGFPPNAVLAPPPGDGWWDTGHTSTACGCNHHWDAHTPFRGCSVCSCKLDPPNQPPPPGEPDEGEPHPWLCPHGATLLCMVCGDLSSGDNKE